MKLKQIFADKKIKNIAVTVCEILVVAAIIFGALMFIYSKVNKEADQTGNVDVFTDDSEAEESEETSYKYCIEVNKKKNWVVVYRYSGKKKNKEEYKVFQCSVGSDVKNGTYETSDTYTWLEINGAWHKYNTKFGDKAWFQSVEYKDKYSYTLKTSSYNDIGEEQQSGSCIMLYARDAQWIYENCDSITEVKIVKVKKSDTLSVEWEQKTETLKYCGWDPTDPDENNPYLNYNDGEITSGDSTVYVEKGSSVDYLSNLIAKNDKGKNIAGKLNYDEISTDNTGTYNVKYTYKTKSGKNMKLTQKIEVVDTTCPEVTCSKDVFEYEVDSLEDEDLHKKSNVEDIKELVKNSVSCNESGVTITVSCISADELKEGLVPVVVTAQDEAGNVGSCQVMCEIKVKEEETTEEVTTKKKEKTTKKKKKKKNKEKETEKATEEEATQANETEETTTTSN